jgi:predicted nucleotidyltransferase
VRKKTKADIFNTTNVLKVLSFLVENPGKQLLGGEIQKVTHISRAGVYIALRELIKQKFVSKQRKGKFLIYSVIYNDPVIRQFKVLKNTLLLRPLISKLEPFSKKIILYGSASRGEDDPKSDIDLFVLSKDTQQVKEVLSKVRIRRKLQAVVKTPSEFADLQEKEKDFYREVNKGIMLWQETE